MKQNSFSGVYLFDRARLNPAGLLRGLLRSSGQGAEPSPSSPFPGLALPPGSSAAAIPGNPGSWLLLKSPDITLELAVQLYAKHGPSFTDGLRGQFAFALYDASAGELLLGADRFSEIPVFYAVFPGGIAWAEEPAPLSRLPGVDAGIDPRAVDRYITMRYLPSPFTLYKGVRKLPPAGMLTAGKGAPAVKVYWNPPMEERKYRSLGEASEAVYAALFDSAKYRLRGVRRAAATVSGGMDSSSAAAMAAKCGVKLDTFTAGCKKADGCDFSAASAVIAKAVGSRHTYIEYDSPDGAAITEMSAGYAEPQADQCAAALWFAAEKMSGGAEVLFSGDGGDENFGGYIRARLMLNMARKEKGPELEALLLKALAAGNSISRETLLKVKTATGNRLETLYSELTRLYFGDTGDFYLPEERRELYTPGFRSSLGQGHKTSVETIREIFSGTAGQDWMSRITLPDLRIFHPDCTVPRLRATAARAGLRAVFPFNDHKLVELARGIPEKWKLPPGTVARNKCKLVLRKAMAPLLPASIINGAQRPFPTPAGEWLAGPLNGFFRDSLLSPGARTAPFFKRRTIERLLAEHVSGKIDRNDELWDLLMLELWLRTH